MNEFILIFHRNREVGETLVSEEALQTYLNHWQDWYRCLAAQEKLAWPVQYWDPVGKVLTANNVIRQGPFSKTDRIMDGLIVVKASDYNEAKEIASECPILDWEGAVEIHRKISYK